MTGREIKFRVWDNDDNTMREVIRIDSTGDEYDGGTIEANGFDYEVFASVLYPLDGTELMQFTGLKDKNGVEIYEGDIIETTINHDWHVVKFDKGRFYGEFKAHGNICGGYSMDTLHKIDMNFQEVVGNIHENTDVE